MTLPTGTAAFHERYSVPLLPPIGQGTFSSVYRAYPHVFPTVERAAKFIFADHNGEEEAALWESLPPHPNLVYVYDTFTPTQPATRSLLSKEAKEKYGLGVTGKSLPSCGRASEEDDRGENSAASPHAEAIEDDRLGKRSHESLTHRDKGVGRPASPSPFNAQVVERKAAGRVGRPTSFLRCADDEVAKIGSRGRAMEAPWLSGSGMLEGPFESRDSEAKARLAPENAVVAAALVEEEVKEEGDVVRRRLKLTRADSGKVAADSGIGRFPSLTPLPPLLAHSPKGAISRTPKSGSVSAGKVEGLESKTHPRSDSSSSGASAERGISPLSSTCCVIVMEFVRGGELFAKVQGGVKLEENEARHIVQCVLAAVQHLHHHGIVHRDIKLENVLLEGGGGAGVKLIDLGMAARVGDRRLLNTSCGSRQYAKPEMLRSTQTRAKLPTAHSTYGKEVDLWAAGVLMYTLLSGKCLLGTEKGLKRQQSILRGRYELPASASATARSLMQELLNVRPEDCLTAVQALSHPWFTSAEKVHRPLLAHLKKKSDGGSREGTPARQKSTVGTDAAAATTAFSTPAKSKKAISGGL